MIESRTIAVKACAGMKGREIKQGKQNDAYPFSISINLHILLCVNTLDAWEDTATDSLGQKS